MGLFGGLTKIILLSGLSSKFGLATVTFLADIMKLVEENVPALFPVREGLPYLTCRGCLS